MLKRAVMSELKKKNSYVRINKSKIESMRFNTEDVLEKEELKKERARYLQRAVSLGKQYKKVVNIRFKNIENRLLETRASIWKVTKSYVVLKNNTHIPIRSISGIYM